MAQKIIFVGGIHGVGKTTFCNNLSSLVNAEIFSASELIAKINKQGFNREKRVSNYPESQKLLLIAINKFLHPKKLYILDGHFCLLNINNKIVKIPVDTFQKLKPICIVLLYDSPKNILSRLKERDSVHWDLGLLEDFQNQEIEYSREIANTLDIPYIKITPNSPVENLYSFLSNFL